MTRRTIALLALPLAAVGLTACGLPEEDPITVTALGTVSGFVGLGDESDTVIAGGTGNQFHVDCTPRQGIMITVDSPSAEPLEYDCATDTAAHSGTVITVTGFGAWELEFIVDPT